MKTMTYSFDKTFDPWETEPDIFDLAIEEEENSKVEDELSIDDVEDSELAFDEEYDL